MDKRVAEILKLPVSELTESNLSRILCPVYCPFYINVKCRRDYHHYFAFGREYSAYVTKDAYFVNAICFDNLLEFHNTFEVIA